MKKFKRLTVNNIPKLKEYFIAKYPEGEVEIFMSVFKNRLVFMSSCGEELNPPKFWKEK